MQKYTPIRQKLRRVIMLTCVVVLLFTSIPMLIYEYVTIRDNARRELMALGKVVAANSTAALAFVDQQDASEVLNSLTAQKHLKVAVLYNAAGQVFTVYPRGAKAPAGAPKPGGFYLFNGRILEGYESVVQEGNGLGTLYLQADMSDMYDRLVLYLMMVLLIVVFSVLFAYQLSKRLQDTLAIPILNLAEIARAVSEDQNYAVRANTKANDEVGQLTDSFNHMLGQIEEKNAEILSLNQNLEQKVVERTKQLESVNAILQQQKEFTETIVDATVHLIAVFDRDLRFVTLNRVANDIYQRDRREIIGKKITEVFPDMDGSPMVANLKAAFAGQSLKDNDYRSPITGRYFEIFFVPLRNQEHVVDQVLVIGHDITEITESNAQLRDLNKKLETSNRDLEQFAYIASHDLQEPLRKIQTFADLSEHNIGNEQALTRYLGKIVSAAERMSVLIKELLNYSRLSRPENAYSLIDLNQVVSLVKGDLELVIQEKEASIIVNQLPAVWGSQVQISQLFFNLLSNSLKFSQTRPVVRINSEVVSGTDIHLPYVANPENTYVLLTFEDNGIGFEQKYADKVFSIFQRLHATHEYAGTGIGLALCKRIVENHRGLIRVESEPGVGTRFFIYLPLGVNAVSHLAAKQALGTA